MRISAECRDPELLAAEVRRLQAVVAAGETTLTDAEREAICFFSQIDGPDNVPVANKRAATLRSLLERLK